MLVTHQPEMVNRLLKGTFMYQAIIQQTKITEKNINQPTSQQTNHYINQQINEPANQGGV